MSFSGNLKQILNDRNLKQADVCRMTGIQTSLMSDYLGGKKSPTIGNAILIADALNISLDTLVGKKTPPSLEELKCSKAISKDVTNKLTAEKSEILKKIQKMSDSEIRAVMAFLNALDSMNKD